MSAKKVPGRQVLVDMAIKEAGYNDFGDPWFFKNLDVLVPILNDEAQLSDSGVDTATGMFVRALVNRLRFQQLLTRHPEIDDEEVSVVACVAGLPRTSSFRMPTFGGGMAGGVPRMRSRIHAPRSTGAVRFGYAVAISTAPLPSRP